MIRPTLVSIHIAVSAGAPMNSLERIEAVAGRGLEGDRYFNSIGAYSNEPGSGREITLIELEAVEALRRDYGIELAPAQYRRNVVTRGIALNHWVGRNFSIGKVMLRATR